MNDILVFTKTHDSKSIQRELIELSFSIQTRIKLLYKIEKQNKWSIPLGIIGLIFTIFGIDSSG